MKYLLNIFFFLSFILNVSAQQNQAEQILIFRNTGETHLFYSDELDSITFSKFDADSIEYEDIISQVFYTSDTALVVPINEIDSVTFGNRNEISFKENVVMMSEKDCEWIIRYDANTIFYRKDTPNEILPSPGDKLFYSKMDSIFPLGLIAKVNSVDYISGEYAVNVSNIELSDIFDKLFYAGKISDIQPEAFNKETRAPLINNNFKILLDVGENLQISGNDIFSIDGNVVTNPLKGYYYFDADVSNELALSLKAQIARKSEIEKEIEIAKIPLGVYAFVFTPSIKLNGFIELSAELSANMKMKRTTKTHINYVKRHGNDPIVTVTNADGNDRGNTSQIGVTCNGELFTGITSTFDFNIIKETLGARLKTKIGPSFSSEFGLSLLQSAAKEYDPDVYGKAKLETCVKLQFKGSVYTKNLIWGDENEKVIVEDEFSFMKHTIDLFPHFFQTKAISLIASKSDENQEDISVSSKNDNVVLTDLQTGFEMLTPDGTAIDSTTADSIFAGTEVIQGITAELNKPEVQTETKDLTIRPTFKYAGYTIKAETTPINDNMYLQPIIFSMCNGSTTILSGCPYYGTARTDSTLIIAGPNIPINITDTIFNERKPITTGIFITSNEEENLIGTWQGSENGEDITYVFNEDNTGVVTTKGVSNDFIYYVNKPQSGQIIIYLQNNNDAKTLFIKKISNGIMHYKVIGFDMYNQINKTSI